MVQGYNEWALDIGDRNVFDGGHGGGDDRMLTALYGPADPSCESSGASGPEPASGDAARQSANERDGALALAVGVAANECFLTGQPARIADLIPELGPAPG